MNKKYKKLRKPKKARKVSNLQSDPSNEPLKVLDVLENLEKMSSKMSEDNVLSDISKILDYVILEIRERCKLAQEVLNEESQDHSKYLH